MAAPSISDKINAQNTYAPNDIVMMYGTTARAAHALAASTSGVPTQKEYKAALRALERQVKGQHKPSKPYQARLNQLGRKGSAAPRKITLSGNIRVNGYVRDRTIDFPGAKKQLSEEQWDRLSNLAASGDDSAVWGQMATDYGGSVTDMELESGTIDVE